MFTNRVVAALALFALVACKSAPPTTREPSKTEASHKEEGSALTGDHAVLVEFQFDDSSIDAVAALEEQLRAAIESASVGEYDGNELAVDGSRQGRLYMYGPSADRLFDVVRPVLEASSLMKGAIAIKRYGPPAAGVREVRVALGGPKG